MFLEFSEESVQNRDKSDWIFACKAFLVKITDMGLQIVPDDRPSGDSPLTSNWINFENKIPRGQVPETEPLFVRIVADDSDILVLQAYPFQGSRYSQRIDKELISRLSNLSVLVRQKTKSRQTTPGKKDISRVQNRRYGL